MPKFDGGKSLYDEINRREPAPIDTKGGVAPPPLIPLWGNIKLNKEENCKLFKTKIIRKNNWVLEKNKNFRKMIKYSLRTLGRE